MTEQDMPPQENASVPPEPPIQTVNDQVQPPQDNYLRNRILVTGCLIATVVIVVALVIIGLPVIGRFITSIGGIGAVPSPSASVLSSQTIVEGIQPLGQLVSLSVQLAAINVKVNVSQGVLNMCAYSVNHAVQGTIEAGIDLTKIDTNALHYDAARETYVLTVPPAELTSCRIDDIQQYNWSVSACNPDFDTARLLANYTALKQFRDETIEGGILARAERETRLVLGNFVRLLTGHPVEIVFQQSEATEMPSSCKPSPPEGWTQDTTTGLWSR